MSTKVAEYRQLEHHLLECREMGDSSEVFEDKMSDKMEALWESMSEDERLVLTPVAPAPRSTS